ncbi:hypothetical protein HOC01_03705 [archaeon]|jgi:hypothetical protein|nr:hypothetical protein [archaeon]MBT6698483.1 hypothetical protein [archaeon]
MRKNIIPTLIILVALLLSTIVLADTPVIPGDGTTTTPGEDGGEDTESDDPEDVAEEEQTNSDECKEQERRLSRAQSDYESARATATRNYEECIGCVSYWMTGDTVTSCKNTDLTDSDRSACYDRYLEEVELAKIQQSELNQEIFEDTAGCFTLSNPGSFLNYLVN